MESWVSTLMSFLRSNGLEEPNGEDGDELVIAFLEGRGSFTSLLSKYNPLLIEKSNNWVEGYSPSDLYQELALKMYQCCESWKPNKGTTFYTYLYGVLDNHLKYLIRRASSKKRTSDLVSMSYENMLQSDDEEHDWANLEPYYEESAFNLIEIIALSQLSEKERICVEMIYEGRMCCEIADRLEMSRAGVSNILKKLQPKFGFLINN